MTDAPWWAGLDDAALQALGSAGLLRRARAAPAGRVHVQGHTAEVDVGTARVRLTERGLAAARCDCPATGLCLHILAAVLALRDTEADPSAPLDTPQRDAADEIAALSQAEIAGFAGSDLPGALALARSAVLPAAPLAGLSVSVVPPGLSDPVTFLVGAGLRGAVWKGPESRRRLAITTAALTLRAARGLDLPPDPDPDQDQDPAQTTPRALAARITSQIEATLPLILGGKATLAADLLLDLALSARIEAAPRLSGAVQGLVRLALDLDQRKPQADAAAVLITAARTHALAHAMAHSMADRPADPDLAGRLRRDYQPAPPLAMVMLGARRWHAATGARGLRLLGYDRAADRWISVGAARPDGLDPAFDPVSAYGGPMLGRPRAADLIGKVLTLDAPRLSADHVLAADSLATIAADPDPNPHLPPVETDWAALCRTLGTALGLPLGRGLRMRVALICPATCDRPQHDGAGLVLPVHDRRGRVLRLALEGVSPQAALALGRLPPGIAMVIEAREEVGRLRLVLVSVVGMASGLRLWSPSLDRVPDWLPPAPPGPAIRPAPPNLPPNPPPNPRARPSPLARLAEDLLLAAEDLARGQTPDPGLAARVVAEGLAPVQSLLTAPGSVAKALRLAWIAAELRWLAAQAPWPVAAPKDPPDAGARKTGRKVLAGLRALWGSGG